MSSVLVMRTCAADMSSYGGFRWPESGPVEAPDWDPTPECGHGLHGLLWGEGTGMVLDWDPSAKWLVCRVDANSIVDIGGKVKFPRCEVVFVGDATSVPAYIAANGGAGRAIVSGTATAGYSGTATAGYRGAICIRYWDGKRYKTRIAQVKDGDGEGELEANTPYRLDPQGHFVAVEEEDHDRA